jgi:NADH-quinone oxidoreductase subunit L
MARQVKMTFFGEPRHEAAEHAEESSPLMTGPLVVLGALAALGGFLNLPFFSESAYKSASAAHDYGIFLAIERWLEHSIESFHLTEEGIVQMPYTPTWIQWDVAGISTGLAVVAILLAWFLVYRGRWQRADERDPLQGTPIWWMSVLPLDTLYMKGLIPLFNRFAHFAGITLDWKFWHDWFHEDIIRAGYINLSRAINFADNRGVDGLVRGAGSVTNLLSGIIRRTQTGFVRNYALGVLLGVVVLIVLFVLPVWMN